MNTSIKNNWLSIAFFIIALLLPTVVLAEPFTPNQGDKAMMLMASLFGDIGMFGASSSDAFSAVIRVFNGACLFIGGILVAYTIIAGTIGTAHDGEMLGKKFSSVWVPIRTALGTALILPILPGGYCALQGIVAWLVVQSIGMASFAWQTYLSSSNLTAAVTMNIQSPDVKQFAYTTLQSLVCVEAMKIEMAKEEATILGGANSDWGITKTESLKNVDYFFGDKNENAGFKRDTCGSLTVTKFSFAGITTPGGAVNSVMNGVSGLIDAAQAIQRSATINTEHTTQVAALIGVLHSQATILVTTRSPLDINVIDVAIANYEKTIKETATREVSALDPFKGLSESAERDGFILAGAFYMKLAFLSDLVNRSMAATPTAQGPSSVVVGGLYKDQMATYMESMDRTLAKAKTATTFGLADVGNATDSSSDGIWDTIRKKLDINAYMKDMLRSTLNFAIQDDEHPLIAIKRLGNTLIQVGSVISIGLIGIIAMANGPLTGLALAGQTVAQILVSPLLLAGGFLSYVVPMMPFFMWLGAVIGWSLLVIEAMVAAPLWAIMHLHPNGDDAVGKGGNGYTLVLSLLLRPIFLVFGLIGSLVVLQVFGQLYNTIFADVFLMNTSDSTNWFMMIITFLASGLIYAGGLWVIIKKSFGLMTDIPDNLINWIGSSAGQLGKHSSDVGGLSSGAYIATQQASQISGALSNSGIKAISDRAMEKKNSSDGDNKLATQLNDKFGSGASDMFNKLHGSEENKGLSSHRTMEESSALKQGLDMFGGSNSSAGNAYLEKFKQSVEENPDLPFKDHLNNAVQSGMENSFGGDSLDVAYKAANGGEADSSSPDVDFLSPNFKRATSYMSSIGKRLEKQGATPTQIQSTFKQLNDKIKSDYSKSPNSVKNGGTKEFKHFFSDEIKNFR
jgi:conjugal transfer/type IV secretion protein DotA/TraY